MHSAVVVKVAEGILYINKKKDGIRLLNSLKSRGYTQFFSNKPDDISYIQAYAFKYSTAQALENLTI
jgi:hypothetical protein